MAEQYQSEVERYIRNTIVDETHRYVRFGGKFKEIAESTGLSVSTVRKFTADPPTRFPRLHTAIALLEFFGYALEGRKVEKDVMKNLARHNMLDTRPN